ncbi:MAG: hypothetical protein M9962_05295 [Oligoflexia bacterium]|nr:hypothetical protein [Oligoflexia bacterium]
MIFLIQLFFSILVFAQGELTTPLKHPIVLVHGATYGGASLKIGFLNFGDYFEKIPAFLSQAGTTVKIADLPTDVGIGERAAVLQSFLKSEFKNTKVNIIAHSLGGLDARYAATVLRSPNILSITTIGTPHRGTPLADWGVNQMKNEGLWYYFFLLLGYDLKGRRFLPELATEYMQKTFNPKVPNRADIQYFSVRTKASFKKKSMSRLLWFTSRWVESDGSIKNGEHDGLVPFESQGWGKILLNMELDHLAQMNHHEWRGKNFEKESLAMYKGIYTNLLDSGL